MNYPNAREHIGSREKPSLGELLSSHEEELTFFAEAGRQLTFDRLRLVAPEAAEGIEHSLPEDLEWPTDASSVEPGEEVFDVFSNEIEPKKADNLFAEEVRLGLVRGTNQRGYNNFTAIIGSKPHLPTEAAWFMEAFHENPAAAIYGTKPYLVRAHLLLPEFMGALQQEVSALGGQAEWNEAILLGDENPYKYPKAARLLRASRLSYGVLVNLMRRDDAVRHAKWLGLDGSSMRDIEDPRIELWT